MSWNYIKKNAGMISFSSFLLLLLLSGSLYQFSEYRQDRVVFFYPEESGSGFFREVRSLPVRKDLYSKIELTIREFMLGPVDLEFRNSVPPGTKISRMVLSGKELYVDFDFNLIKNKDSETLNLDEIFEITEKIILFNYREIEHVFFTIEGQVPYSSYFQISDEKI